MYNNYIIDSIKKSIEVKESILNNEELLNKISEAAKYCVDCYKNNGKLLIGGNGGSAADSQHIAAELISKFNFDRDPLPAIALTVDTSIITAIGNDYGYDKLFLRQIKGNACKNDIFLGITTSGNSKNIIEALEYTKRVGIKSICLNGKDGGVIEEKHLADVNIIVPSNETPRIQESHIVIGHILCAIIEREMFE